MRTRVTRETIAAQSRTSAGALVLTAVIVAAAVFLTAAVPVAIAAVGTREIRTEVAAAPRDTNVVVSVSLTGTQGEGFELAPDTVDSAQYIRDVIEDGMPAGLRAVMEDPVTTLLGPELKMGAVDGHAARLRFAYVSQSDSQGVTWVEGREPEATGTAIDVARASAPLPIEVGLSQAVAELLGVGAGATLPVVTQDDFPLTVNVTGVYRPNDPEGASFATVPTLLHPQVGRGAGGITYVAALTSEGSLPFARLATVPMSMDRFFTYRVKPQELTSANAGEIALVARGIASGKQVFTIVAADPKTSTRLDAVLGEALAHNRAATAQAAVLLISVIVAMALAQILAASIVVDRRARVLRGLRSRGASLASVGRALGVESFVVTAVGVGVGLGVQQWLYPGPLSWGWIAAPILVSLLASPVLGMRAAAVRGRGFVSPRTGPVRVTLEITLGVAALASLFALRARGIGASEGALGADVLVLAAPALCALAFGVLLARALPWCVRSARRFAARARSAAPMLAAAQMRTHVAATLAFVVAASVVGMAASTAATVSAGQERASWEAIGGDVLVLAGFSGPLPEAVTDVSGGDVVFAWVNDVASIEDDAGDHAVRLVAVDAAAMAALASKVPGADAGPWEKLAASPGTGDSVGALLAGDAQVRGDGTVLWEQINVPVTTLGRLREVPGGLPDAPGTVFVDRSALEAVAGADLPATAAWAFGADSAAALAEAAAGSDATVSLRSEFLDAAHTAPVTAGLAALFVGAALVAVLFAGLGVALLVAAGAREREGDMGRLRVVGFPRKTVSRVARAQVAVPVVVASAVGVGAGYLLMFALVDPLNLSAVTGEAHAPAVVIAWWAALVPLVLGVFAWIAVGVAVKLGRPLKLGEVMRAG